MTAPVEFQFPIEKLPERPFSYVLRTMDLVDRAAYSFISPETKQQICALPQKEVADILVFFHKYIRIGVIFNGQFCGGVDFYFYEHEVLDPALADLPPPKSMEIRANLSNQRGTILPNTKGFSLKEYIDHISEIFHVRGLTMLNLRMPMDLYPAEPIRNAFHRFPTIFIVNVNQTCSEQIAYDFVSKAEHCTIVESHPFGPKTLEKVYMQNFTKLCTPFHPITLNDLLMINGNDVDITSKMTYKELNRFLKSWQAGTHPRLRKLKVLIRRRNEVPIAKDLYSGIKTEEASEVNKMKFDEYRNYDGMNGPIRWVFMVRDIWTKDGSRTATIFLCREIPGMEMIVHE